MILSFLLVLWKSHRLSFDHIHVLCTIPPGPLPPQVCACHLTLWFFCCCCFVPTRQVQFMLPIGSWTRALHWNMAGCTLKGNWLSLPQWLSVANNFLGRGEVSPQLSCFMLGCGLTWACTGLMHAFTVTESADVHLPCCEGRHVSCNHPSLLVLTLFCVLLWTDSWSLGEGSVVQMSHFFGWAFWCLLFSTSWPVEGRHIVIYCKNETKHNEKHLSWGPMIYYCTQKLVCLLVLIRGFRKISSFYACVFCWLVCTMNTCPVQFVTLYYKGTFIALGIWAGWVIAESLWGVLFTLNNPDPSSAQTYFPIMVHLKDLSCHRCCMK